LFFVCVRLAQAEGLRFGEAAASVTVGVFTAFVTAGAGLPWWGIVLSAMAAYSTAKFLSLLTRDK